MGAAHGTGRVAGGPFRPSRVANLGSQLLRISAHSDAVVELDRLARLLDSQWRIPGTQIRFGADAVAGLVPVVGDLATAVLSAYIVARAADVGAPKSLMARMVGNVVLDTVVGSIPLIGSVFDVFYKANNRNIRLLQRHLEKRFDAKPSESAPESRA